MITADQEWEIFARYKDHYGIPAKESVGTIFAPSRRAAVKKAIREFGADVGSQLTARLLEQ